MRNYSKYYFLMVVAMISGCRSHKAIEEDIFASVDSCKVETSLNVQSLTNIATTESSDSSIRQDHFEFEGGAGIIQIHSDGEVTIKGLKAATLTHKSNHKTLDRQVSASDSMTSVSNSKSTSAIAAEVKKRKEPPSSNSNWLKHTLLVVIILLVTLLPLLRHRLKL